MKDHVKICTVRIGRLNVYDGRASLRQTPDAIMPDGILLSFIKSVLDRVIQPPPELIDKILQDGAAPFKGGLQTGIDVIEKGGCRFSGKPHPLIRHSAGPRRLRSEAGFQTERLVFLSES